MGANDRLWTHDETAAWLHISPWTLHHLCVTDRGPSRYKVGKHHRYDPAEVRAWLHTTTLTASRGNTARTAKGTR